MHSSITHQRATCFGNSWRFFFFLGAVQLSSTVTRITRLRKTKKFIFLQLLTANMAMYVTMHYNRAHKHMYDL